MSARPPQQAHECFGTRQRESVQTIASDHEHSSASSAPDRAFPTNRTRRRRLSGTIPVAQLCVAVRRNRAARATTFLESDRPGVPGPDDPHGDTANVMARSRAASSSLRPCPFRAGRGLHLGDSRRGLLCADGPVLRRRGFPFDLAVGSRGAELATGRRMWRPAARPVRHRRPPRSRSGRVRWPRGSRPRHRRRGWDRARAASGD